jgi:chromosome segregation ATPase
VQVAAFRSTGESQKAITNTLDEATSRLTRTLEAQQSQLAQYEGKIQQFTQVVDGLDTSIAGIMKATSEGLRDYNEKIRLNFQAIVDVADKLVPQAARMLQTQIEQFSEQLEGLNDTLSTGLGKQNGRR